jgi:heme oxygenase
MRTGTLHAESEALLRLPSAILNRRDYGRWLGRFLGLYDPLERILAGFSEWAEIDMALIPQARTSCLFSDLLALGSDPDRVPRAPPPQLPELPTFAHAVGARYVLEGARLGGRVILRDLEARIGPEIGEATAFFGEGGAPTVPSWPKFQAALDSFGRGDRGICEDAVIGAERSFRSLLAWFAAFCSVAETSR